MGRAAKRRAILSQGRTPGSYTQWPHACANSEHYRSLSAHAKALLLDFLCQYTGFNNGDLCCAFKLMKKRGWNSRTTVEKARAELERKGWIVRTLQGWRNKPNLYALTFYKIDDMAKLDMRETKQALGFWKEGRNPIMEEQLQARPKLKRPFSSYTRCATQTTTRPYPGQPDPLN